MKVIVDYSQGSDLIRIAANPTHSGSYCCHLGNGKVFLLFMTFIYYVSISKSTWGHCSHDINPACEQIHNMTLSKGVLSTHHTVDEALFMVWTPHPSNVCAAEKVTKVWTAIVRSHVYLQVNVTHQTCHSSTNTAADSRPAVTLLWQTEGPHSGGFHTHLPGSFTQSQLISIFVLQVEGDPSIITCLQRCWNWEL